MVHKRNEGYVIVSTVVWAWGHTWHFIHEILLSMYLHYQCIRCLYTLESSSMVLGIQMLFESMFAAIFIQQSRYNSHRRHRALIKWTLFFASVGNVQLFQFLPIKVNCQICPLILSELKWYKTNVAMTLGILHRLHSKLIIFGFHLPTGSNASSLLFLV